MPNYTSVISRLIEAFPDASDDAIKALARAQGFIKKGWDWGNKPTLSFGSETTQNPVGRFGLGLAEGMTSPLGLGSLLLSGGSAAAGKLGMMGLAKGGLMAEAALNAPSVAHGAYTAAAAPTMGGKAAGLAEAGLGVLGASSPARTMRRMNKSLEQAPEMLASARAHGGVSMDPDLGDLGGKPGFAVGGMIAPEGKGTVPLADLSTEEFQRYIMDNARAMGKKNQFPGLWQDEETGKAAMDITTRLFNPQQATREGVLAGQKTIFDLGKYAERPIRGLPVRTRTAILKGGPESMEAYGSPTRFGGMLGLGQGDIRGLAQGGDQDAISALLRLVQDETGAVGGGRPTLGLGSKAKGMLDKFEADAAARPTLAAPKMSSVAEAMRKGEFRGEGGAPRPQALREGDIPGFKQNRGMSLQQVIKVGPRMGAQFAPEAQRRLDQILQWVDSKGFDPAEIDWANSQWKPYFNSPQEADIMARLVGALSPQKKSIPNVRDAVSTLLQRNMGIDPQQMARPFGMRHTGFGFGFADADESSVVSNIRKAMANEPIGSVYPNKVNELGEGMIGNVRALPWDMHWSRALGLKSDEPGSALQYALMKMAGEDALTQRGFKGSFPGMAKVWSGEKLAVAEHEPGFTELMRRINAQMPQVLKGYAPKDEKDYFDTMAQLQEVLGGKLSRTHMKTLRGQAQPSLFDFGQ